MTANLPARPREDFCGEATYNAYQAHRAAEKAAREQLRRTTYGRKKAAERHHAAIIAAADAGISHREIAELAGVSHPTVGRILAREDAPEPRRRSRGARVEGRCDACGQPRATGHAADCPYRQREAASEHA